jgi:hypothetical protein
MAINTLITIRDAIQAFVDGHGQLQAVRFGADDKRAPYLTEQELFPVLYVAPVDVEVGRAHNTHRLRVYVYERLNDADQDEWENANDTSLILRDIRVWWNDYGIDDILIETDPTGTFKTDSELDNLVGYYAEILFQIPSHGRCDVPVSIEPVPPPTCEDASYIVKYANGDPIESGTIPSGESVTVVVPNCPPAGDVVWTLFDTDGNVLDSGTEPAGGTLTIVAPDATFDINGVQVATIPSGGSDSIQVRRASGSTQVGSLQGQHWRVANTTVQLRDSAANNIGAVNSYGAESSNNLTAPDGTVTVNRDGVFFADVDVASGGTATVDVDVPFWQRNPDWLPLPEISAGDNRFVGLYAVFEDGLGGNHIEVGIFNVGTGNTIDYGDGTIDSLATTNTHLYDYATLGGVILQTIDGRNYKQVLVSITLNGVDRIFLNQNTLIATSVNSNWLDVEFAGSDLIFVSLSSSFMSNSKTAKYIERFVAKELQFSTLSLASLFVDCLSLRVFEYNNINNTVSLQNSFENTGDFRDNNGQPIIINNNQDVNISRAFTFCKLSSPLNFSFPNSTFVGGNWQVLRGLNSESLILDISSTSGGTNAFRDSNYKNIQITNSITLNTLNNCFVACFNLERLEFINSLENVNNTANAFLNCFSLRRLILPDITVGFDIRQSQITGDNLQDLFTSLGTAAGAQTITLPTFTTGEDTTIATGKGYTIAYA